MELVSTFNERSPERVRTNQRLATTTLLARQDAEMMRAVRSALIDRIEDPRGAETSSATLRGGPINRPWKVLRDRKQLVFGGVTRGEALKLSPSWPNPQTCSG